MGLDWISIWRTRPEAGQNPSLRAIVPPRLSATQVMPSVCRNCRANAAKSGLVSKGVPAGSITASGRGESELLVKTGDNVKEPQNRRATIDLD